MLERLKAREAAAQRALTRTAYPRVQRICRWYLGDQLLAEHTAQDVLTDFLFSEVDRVRSERAIPSYLRMMAVRRCRRVRAWRDRHEPWPEQDLLSPRPELDLADRLDTDRRIVRLERCMEGLAPRVRRVMRMRFHLEMTQTAIGESLAVSKQYAGRLVAAGLDSLRRCMEEHDEAAA